MNMKNPEIRKAIKTAYVGSFDDRDNLDYHKLENALLDLLLEQMQEAWDEGYDQCTMDQAEA